MSTYSTFKTVENCVEKLKEGLFVNKFSTKMAIKTKKWGYSLSLTVENYVKRVKNRGERVERGERACLGVKSRLLDKKRLMWYNARV